MFIFPFNNSKITIYIYSFLLLFIPLISLSLQREELEDLIASQTLENLFLLPISSANDIITKNVCSLNFVAKCLRKSFLNSECFSNIYNNRFLDSSILNDKNNNATKKDHPLLENTEAFYNHLTKCCVKEINKRIDLKLTALPILTHSSGGISQDLSPLSVYPNCMKDIKECFNGGRKCLIPSRYNIFDKIINFCSDEAFTKLNLTFKPSKRPIKTYIDELVILAKKKIGPVLDSYTTNLPQKYIDTFGNLTYEEFDALKMIAATIPFLKQFLCDPREDSRIARSFEFIENYLILGKSPQLSEKVRNMLNTFTTEIYKAVKYMLMAQPSLRWSFYSPIFAISPSKELTKIYPPQITLWSLQNCRGIADQNIMTRSAICEGPGLLFGKK